MRWSSLCEKVHTVWTITEHKSSHLFFGDVIRFGRFWKIHVLLRPSLTWITQKKIQYLFPLVCAEPQHTHTHTSYILGRHGFLCFPFVFLRNEDEDEFSLFVATWSCCCCCCFGTIIICPSQRRRRT